ncbi:helix-turn-helix domain-containing protein [Azohydromonas aeria]|uniref:helix-turn-helix domain-containing protein n=1 Tax=Azohydromonas aeria TaxID=2590212 RepID=UPI001E2F193B|nr:helix-turn-helix domain-containing protein [Azohydromonas aeria]
MTLAICLDLPGMKSTPHLIETDSRIAARSRPKSKPSEDFVSVAETRALMAGSVAFRQKRLEAGDMVSTDEAAEMTGTSRVTINAWINKGRAIGLTQIKRGFRMPRWQFDAPMWDVLPQLSQALGTKEGWALLAFLETPHGGLNGATPREAIERGEGARVVDLAARGS